MKIQFLSFSQIFHASKISAYTVLHTQTQIDRHTYTHRHICMCMGVCLCIVYIHIHAHTSTHTHTYTTCYLFSLLRCQGGSSVVIFKHYTKYIHSQYSTLLHYSLLFLSSSPGPPGMTKRPLPAVARGLSRPLAAMIGGRPVNERR